MAVMARETWTDERLDDLNGKVEKGFGEVKGEISDLRAEIHAMQRTMILGFAGIVASIVATNL
jgi:hypothetical protein